MRLVGSYIAQLRLHHGEFRAAIDAHDLRLAIDRIGGGGTLVMAAALFPVLGIGDELCSVNLLVAAADQDV